MKTIRNGLASFGAWMKSVLLSALFWFICLALSGAVILAVGVTIQFGLGSGLMAFGAFCVVGAGVILGGLRHG